MEHLAQFIINHWGLWLLLLIILISIFVNEIITQKMRAKTLSPEALVTLLNDDNALVIDLRDKETYKKGHIINALHASEDDFLSQRMDKHKSKKLVLVCARGQQSSVLAAKLQKAGFRELLVLAGGMQAWRASDLPVVKEK